MSEPRLQARSDAVGESSPYWGVHFSRYRFAAGLVTGGRVLDIACGTGYGLPAIGERATLTVGVDLDADVVRCVGDAVRGPEPVAVLAGDGLALPFAHGSFDFVTSFETLEHLEHRERFIGELARVLKPDGLLVLSTPNALVTLPVNGKPRNPHHRHEYEPPELLGLLQKHFLEAELLGQSLSERFVVPPLREDQLRMEKTLGNALRVTFWRALNKLPAASVRDGISRAVWGHGLRASAADYVFSPSSVRTAPVTVALCRKAIRGPATR